MTLFRQLLMVLFLTCLLLLVGGIGVSVMNSRAYIQEQLSVSAQNTAHSLALSIAPAMSRHDPILADTMIRAVFDQGYYRRIDLIDAEDKILVHYERASQANQVPTLLRHWIHLSPAVVTTTINAGWIIAGTLVVESDQSRAYQNLWRMVRQEFDLFASVMLFVGVFSYAALRWLTKPLAEIEAQAEAMYRRDFHEIQHLPRTRELRRVVLAMNRMSRQMRALVGDLLRQVEFFQHQAYVDTVTGLANQAAFDSELGSLLADVEKRMHGALIIFQIDAFSELNARLGRDAADQLLIQVAGRFLKLQEDHSDALVARRQGADFVAFLPNISRDSAEKVLNSLMASVRELPLARTVPNIMFYAGMSYTDVNGEPTQLLPKASLALRLAREGGVQGSHVLQADASHDGALAVLGHGLEVWKSRLDDLLQTDQLQLHYLPCVDLDNRLLHKEVLVRLVVENQVMAAASFIPLIEQFGWESRLDHLVVEKVLHYQMHAAALGLPLDCLSINLSPYSLKLPSFVDALIARIQQVPSVLPYLWFEVSESALVLAPQAVKRLAQWLDDHGSGLVVDRFVMRQSSLAMLGTLPLRALKMDSAMVRDTDKNPDQLFMLSTLLHVAHSRDMLLLADSVEFATQWKVMRQLHVDGGQGFLFGKPRPLEGLPEGV